MCLSQCLTSTIPASWLSSPIRYLEITLLCLGLWGLWPLVGQPPMISTNTPVDIMCSGLIYVVLDGLFTVNLHGLFSPEVSRPTKGPFPCIYCTVGNDDKQNQIHWITWGIICDILSGMVINAMYVQNYPWVLVFNKMDIQSHDIMLLHLYITARECFISHQRTQLLLNGFAMDGCREVLKAM